MAMQITVLICRHSRPSPPTDSCRSDLTIRPYPKRLTWFLSALPFLVTFTHVFVSPYTKVEESFTLHAVHDILAYGTEYKKWDYVQFPGAVPRSFLPSMLIAVANWPWVKAATAMGIVGTKLGVQVMSECLVVMTLTLCGLWGTVPPKKGVPRKCALR